MKILSQFASFHHFTFDQGRKACYGRYQGYNVVVSYVPAQKNYVIQLSVSSENESINEDAKNYFFGLVSHYDFVHYANYSFPNLTVSVKRKGNVGNQLDHMLDLIIRYLTSQGFKNTCQSSKSFSSEVGIYSVQGRIYMMNEESFQNITSSFEAFNERLPKENFGLGLLGAFLGTLGGAALFMVLYRIGIIAAFSGVLMFYGAVKLYQKFGKILSKKALYSIVFMCLIMIAFALYLSLGLEIYLSLKDYYYISLFDSLQLVPSIAKDPAVLPHILKDLGFSYLFLLISGFTSIKNIHQQLNHQNEASRLL